MTPIASDPATSEKATSASRSPARARSVTSAPPIPAMRPSAVPEPSCSTVPPVWRSIVVWPISASERRPCSSRPLRMTPAPTPVLTVT